MISSCVEVAVGSAAGVVSVDPLRQTFARYQQVVLSATSGSMLLGRTRCRVRRHEDVGASEAARRYVRDPAMG